MGIYAWEIIQHLMSVSFSHRCHGCCCPLTISISHDPLTAISHPPLPLSCFESRQRVHKQVAKLSNRKPQPGLELICCYLKKYSYWHIKPQSSYFFHQHLLYYRFERMDVPSIHPNLSFSNKSPRMPKPNPCAASCRAGFGMCWLWMNRGGWSRSTTAVLFRISRELAGTTQPAIIISHSGE